MGSEMCIRDSYLMFTDKFCQELIELGYNDAIAQRDELVEFLKK